MALEEEKEQLLKDKVIHFMFLLFTPELFVLFFFLFYQIRGIGCSHFASFIVEEWLNWIN